MQGQHFQARGRGGLALQAPGRGGIEQQSCVLETRQRTGRPRVATHLPGGEQPIGQRRLGLHPGMAHEVGHGIGQPAGQPRRLNGLPGRSGEVGEIEGAPRFPSTRGEGLQLPQLLQGFIGGWLHRQDTAGQPVRQRGLRRRRQGGQRARQFGPGLRLQLRDRQRWQQGQGRRGDAGFARAQGAHGEGRRVFATAGRGRTAGEQATPEQPVGARTVAGIGFFPEARRSRPTRAGRRQGTHEFTERKQRRGRTTRTGAHVGQESGAPHCSGLPFVSGASQTMATPMK